MKDSQQVSSVNDSTTVPTTDVRDDKTGFKPDSFQKSPKKKRNLYSKSRQKLAITVGGLLVFLVFAGVGISLLLSRNDSTDTRSQASADHLVTFDLLKASTEKEYPTYNLIFDTSQMPEGSVVKVFSMGTSFEIDPNGSVKGTSDEIALVRPTPAHPASTSDPENPDLACNIGSGPVCGTDGRTYVNDCEARKAQVDILYLGGCRVATPPPTSLPSVPPATPKSTAKPTPTIDPQISGDRVLTKNEVMTVYLKKEYEDLADWRAQLKADLVNNKYFLQVTADVKNNIQKNRMEPVYVEFNKKVSNADVVAYQALGYLSFASGDTSGVLVDLSKSGKIPEGSPVPVAPVDPYEEGKIDDGAELPGGPAIKPTPTDDETFVIGGSCGSANGICRPKSGMLTVEPCYTDEQLVSNLTCVDSNTVCCIAKTSTPTPSPTADCQLDSSGAKICPTWATDPSLCKGTLIPGGFDKCGCSLPSKCQLDEEIITKPSPDAQATAIPTPNIYPKPPAPTLPPTPSPTPLKKKNIINRYLPIIGDRWVRWGEPTQAKLNSAKDKYQKAVANRKRLEAKVSKIKATVDKLKNKSDFYSRARRRYLIERLRTVRKNLEKAYAEEIKTENEYLRLKSQLNNS
ncbi:MAG: Kazal-type serine protease inhibitor domain-containing protein [Patescibacteria group bacterium]